MPKHSWSKPWKNPESKETFKVRERKDGKRDMLVWPEGARPKPGADHEHHIFDEHGNVEFSCNQGRHVVADNRYGNTDHSSQEEHIMGKETSRGQIEKGKTKTKKEFQESKKKFEKGVKTKKAISDASRAASVAGTDEGMKKVKKSMEGAGKETDKQFDKDVKQQEKVVKTEAVPRVKKLNDMSKKTKDDVKKIEKALSSAEVDAPKKDLKEAAGAGKDDAQFTEKKGKEQDKDQKTAEKTAKEKSQAMKRARVKFKR